MKQYFKEFIHNVIVHPLMMILPSDKARKLHDINGDWTFKAYGNELKESLTGVKLALAMLERGDKAIACAVHDESEEQALSHGYYVTITGLAKDGQFEGYLEDWVYAVPVDFKGKAVTSKDVGF